MRNVTRTLEREVLGDRFHTRKSETLNSGSLTGDSPVFSIINNVPLVTPMTVGLALGSDICNTNTEPDCCMAGLMTLSA